MRSKLGIDQLFSNTVPLQVLVCCFYQIFVSFVPSRVLRRVFPPVVTGTCLVLLGSALIGAGFANWGGGIFCSSQVLTTKIPCSGNGEVVLAFGHRVYLGLGLVVFFAIIFAELFGSPFIRNIEVIVGLLVGMIVASSVHYSSCDETGTCKSLRCAPFINRHPPCGSFDLVTVTIGYCMIEVPHGRFAGSIAP